MNSDFEASPMQPPSPPPQSELAAEIGHELRSPLTSILAFTDALQYEVFGPLTPGQKQALLSIREGAERQTSLIADLMDLRRLETGGILLTPVPCRLTEIVDRAFEKAAELVRSRTLHLSREVVPENLTISADAKRLEQVVTQLLMAGLRAADTNSVAHLSIRQQASSAGLILTLLVARPDGDASPPPPGPSEAAVEQRLRKLGPVGLVLLQRLLALHDGGLVIQESAAGCLRLTASMSCGPGQ